MTQEQERAAHPGKTKAQREALDQIGCGNFSPRMGDKTRDALLEQGLIVKCGSKIICQDRFGTVAIPEFQMPIPVHMQWCDAVAFTDEEMAEFEKAEAQNAERL